MVSELHNGDCQTRTRRKLGDTWRIRKRSAALVAIRREIATTQAELLRNYVQLALSPGFGDRGAVRIELPWGLAEWGLAQALRDSLESRERNTIHSESRKVGRAKVLCIWGL